MGEIAVPINLFHDAVDEHDYKNKELIQVLRQASNAVLDILSGHRPHRIWDLFAFWMKESGTNSPDSQARAATNFGLAFDFPIYPGDIGLIQPFLLRIEQAAWNTSGFDHSHRSIVSSLALVLFRVVATRFYLAIPPSYDELIFFLGYRGSFEPLRSTLSPLELDACQGRIVRAPTRHEQAYWASVSGVVDTRRCVLSDGFLYGSLTRVPSDNISGSTTPFQPLLSSRQPFNFPQEEPAYEGLFEARQDLLPPVPLVLWDPSMIPPGTSRPKPRRLGTTPPKVKHNLLSSPLMHIIPPVQTTQPTTSDIPTSEPSSQLPSSAHHPAPTRTLRSHNKRKEADSQPEVPPVKRIKHKGGYYAIITESVPTGSAFTFG